ncbi:MAG TPA: hypothetical protein VFC93_03655 [Chloroflexota bacterium]|jgi:hypothetical protein|nr:hypothetical protein [Chloroflexota bacterium]
MRMRPIRRATTRLVLSIGVLCLLVGLLQASIGLAGWPTDLQRAADLATAALLLGLGVTLVSFRRW